MTGTLFAFLTAFAALALFAQPANTQGGGGSGDIWSKFDNQGEEEEEEPKLQPPTPEEILERPEIAIELPSEFYLKISQIVTDEERFPAVQLYVSALDQNGAPIKTLKPEHFKVMEEDRDGGEIVFADPMSRAPLAVCFVVDVSASMEPALDLEKAALKSFLDKMGPDDRAAIVSFSDVPSIEYYFTDNKDSLKDTVDALKTINQTALWDAIKAGMDLLLPQDGFRRALVVLTDGLDNQSTETVSSVMAFYRDNAETQNKGFSVFALGLGVDIEQAALDQLSQRTGGRFLFSPTPGDLDRVYHDILNQIQNEYILEYRSPHLSDKGRTVTVHLDADYYGKKASAEALYRIPGLGAALARWMWPGVILTVIMAVVLIIVTYLKITRAVWLTVMITPLEGKDFTITGGVATIGSLENNDVMLRHDASIQPNHAVLKETRDGYVIEALSRDHPIGIGTEWVRRVVLRDRDSFWLGRTQFVFREKALREGERHPAERDFSDLPSLETMGDRFEAARLPAKLVAISGPHAGEVFALTQGRKIYIGRANRGAVPGSAGAQGAGASASASGSEVTVDVVLARDNRASRVHAAVRLDEMGCWAMDLGSTNGTYVDGVRVTVETPLLAGSTLQVGDTVLRAE
ncbi:MAG: VWA domain-containing protein [bacterium]